METPAVVVSALCFHQKPADLHHSVQMSSSRLVDSRESIHFVFGQFRDDLDAHHDRREHLIKSSRDVTNLSKKVIFLLHRIIAEDAGDVDDPTLGRRAASHSKGKLEEIQALFADLRHDLAGDNFARYQRNISPGLQEYIEALSFAHYLEYQTLISYEQVQGSLSDRDGTPYFFLPLEDYLLGLSDLTGELMRFAIAAISRKGGRQKANDICKFIRICKADFDGVSPHYKELRKKQHVTIQSLEKIEDANYAVAVRTSEYAHPPESLEDLVAQVPLCVNDLGEHSRRVYYRDNED